MTATPNNGNTPMNTRPGDAKTGVKPNEAGAAQPSRGFETYPELGKSWQAKQGEIDKQIVEHYNGGTPNADELPGKIGKWFGTQQTENAAKTEFSKASGESNFLQAQVQDRSEQLHQQGKLKNYKPQEKSQAGAAGQSNNQPSGSKTGR